MRSPFACSPFLRRPVAVALCLIVVLAGCASEERPRGTGGTDTSPSNSDTTAHTTVADDELIQSTGTIRYVDLEGGFYGLVATDGTKYDPAPLPDTLRVDGLQVRFQAKEKDVMTTRMWGTPIEVIEIERIGEEND